MNRSVVMLSLTVKDRERAFLMRNGRFERVLEPGLHRMFDPLRELAAEVCPTVQAEFPADRYAVLKVDHPDLATTLFEVVETGAGEIAVLNFDGRPAHLFGPWTMHVFWKVTTRVDAERINVAVDPKVDARHLRMLSRDRHPYVTEAVIESHEAGLLYIDGRLVERLEPGRHAFWTIDRKVEIKRLDLRPQAVEITAQEMLTKDRVALRVTLTALRRIADPERAVAAVTDIDAWLYRLVQFAIREAAAARTLDEVLSAKAVLDAELRTYVRERVASTGIEVMELGVKNIILPGEIRDLVNKVVEAERTAKANLIRRQEETAATRSLLNTAKLMEENPLLLRPRSLSRSSAWSRRAHRPACGRRRRVDALFTRLVRLQRPSAQSERV